MKLKIWSLFIVVALFGISVGCSDVGFDSVPTRTCENNVDRDTQCKAGSYTNTYTFSFRVGEVDILFVNDNSGSMFAEQQKMANAFPNFLNRMSNLFYQIAIITTDVSASPKNSAKREANGFGDFQDGKFLTFTDLQNNSSGLKIISQDTQNADELFRGTIERRETLKCDQNKFAAEHCPSSDERGIYAANLAIERGSKQFFRSGAHLAIVILTDEDERGTGGNTLGYPLEAKDLPETLVLNMTQRYSTKSLSVHGIMVRPGDSACLREQTQISVNGGWPTYGAYGNTYAQLTNPSVELAALGNIMPGSQGSICTNDNDYGSLLSGIGQNIRNHTLDSPKKLNCYPEADTLQIATSPAGFESQIEYAIDDKNKIYFENVPLGVEVQFVYRCPRFGN